MTKTQLCICLNYKNIKIKGLQDKVAELEKELDAYELKKEVNKTK